MMAPASQSASRYIPDISNTDSMFRPESVVLLFRESSSSLMMNISQEKIKTFFLEIFAFLCNIWTVLFIYFLFFFIPQWITNLWNGSVKDLRNNKSFLTVWDSHQKVWRLNIHCDNSLVVDMAKIDTEYVLYKDGIVALIVGQSQQSTIQFLYFRCCFFWLWQWFSI